MQSQSQSGYGYVQGMCVCMAMSAAWQAVRHAQLIFIHLYTKKIYLYLFTPNKENGRMRWRKKQKRDAKKHTHNNIQKYARV